MFGSFNFIKASNQPFHSFKEKALKAGSIAPEFTIAYTAGIWQEHLIRVQHHDMSLSQLCRKRPLLLSFYSPQWHEYADIQLSLLQKLQKKLEEIQVENLVVTNVEVNQLQEIYERYKLTLNIAADPQNKIASKFGVFQHDFPLQEYVSGIYHNIPFPASFLILPNKTIIHHFFDETFETFLSFKEIEAFVNNYKSQK